MRLLEQAIKGTVELVLPTKVFIKTEGGIITRPKTSHVNIGSNVWITDKVYIEEEPIIEGGDDNVEYIIKELE